MRHSDSSASAAAPAVRRNILIGSIFARNMWHDIKFAPSAIGWPPQRNTWFRNGFKLISAYRTSECGCGTERLFSTGKRSFQRVRSATTKGSVALRSAYKMVLRRFRIYTSGL